MTVPLSLKICTYNIWNPQYPRSDVGKGALNLPERERLQRISAAIGQINPDIVALQEVSRDAYRELAKLNEYSWFYAPHLWNRQQEGVAIGVTNGLGRPFKLIPQIEKKYPIPQGDSKQALFVPLIEAVTGKTILVATSHFKGGPPPGRDQGDTELRETLLELKKEEADLKILAADFNQEAGSPVNNRIEIIGKKEFGFQEKMEGGYNTEPSTGRRIDAILFKTPSNIEIPVETVKESEVSNYKGLSDHLPFIQTITLPHIQVLLLNENKQETGRFSYLRLNWIQSLFRAILERISFCFQSLVACFYTPNRTPR